MSPENPIDLGPSGVSERGTTVGTRVRPTEVGAQLITGWLASRGLAFVSSDGAFATSIRAGSAGEEQELRIRALITPGRPPGILFAASGPSSYARDQWPAALTACNVWNTTVPAPKARLAVDDWEGGDAAPVVLEAWIPLVPDLSQLAVNGLAETLVRGAIRFWTGRDAGAQATSSADS